MNSVWAIANDHGEWTIAVGDGITFMDCLPASNRLVRRTGTMNAPPTLAGSTPDAPVIDVPVWCVRGTNRLTGERMSDRQVARIIKIRCLERCGSNAKPFFDVRLVERKYAEGDSSH